MGENGTSDPDRWQDPAGEGGTGADGSPGFAGFGARRPPSQTPAFAGEAQQLSLGEDDVRLPWLESDDDDAPAAGSASGAQLLTLLAAGIFALALIAVTIWWVTRKEEVVLVADGGMIKAPAQPYKERPRDPGGEVAAGTNDTSFVVAEGGQGPQIKVADDAAPKPGFSSLETPSPAPGAKPSASASAEPAAEVPAGPGVQVGAYATQAQAEAGWGKVVAQYPPLASHRHRIVQGRADIGTVYRLQAVPGDLAAARALCEAMRGAGVPCQVRN